MQADLSQTYLFPRKRSSAVLGWVKFVGAILCFGVMILGFALSMFAKPNLMAFHGITTVPALFGVALAAAAFASFRAPRLVSVGPDALHVDRGPKIDSFTWSQLGWTKVESGMMGRQILNVYGADGKKTLTLTPDLLDFKSLCEIITAHLAGRSDPALDNAKLRKLRRQSVLLFACGIAAIALSAAVGVMAAQDRRAVKLLETNGVAGEAKIIRKFTAPNGVTRRIEYRIDDGGRSATNNVEINRQLWPSLNEGDSIPVRFVPGEPSISKLITGQIDDGMQMSGAMAIALPVLVGLMGLFFLVVGVMSARGMDIEFDSNTRKFKITRVSRTPMIKAHLSQ